jgi:outer membrane lipoprotein-sorting protein
LRSAEWGFDAASGRVDFFEFAAKDGSVFRMDFRNVELNGALPDGLFRFED